MQHLQQAILIPKKLSELDSKEPLAVSLHRLEFDPSQIRGEQFVCLRQQHKLFVKCTYIQNELRKCYQSGRKFLARWERLDSDLDVLSSEVNNLDDSKVQEVYQQWFKSLRKITDEMSQVYSQQENPYQDCDLLENKLEMVPLEVPVESLPTDTTTTTTPGGMWHGKNGYQGLYPHLARRIKKLDHLTFNSSPGKWNMVLQLVRDVEQRVADIEERFEFLSRIVFQLPIEIQWQIHQLEVLEFSGVIRILESQKEKNLNIFKNKTRISWSSFDSNNY